MERGERREFDGLHYWKGFMDGAIITLDLGGGPGSKITQISDEQQPAVISDDILLVLTVFDHCP